MLRTGRYIMRTARRPMIGVGPHAGARRPRGPPPPPAFSPATVCGLSGVTLVPSLRIGVRARTALGTERSFAMSTFATITQFARMLNNLDQWLQNGLAYAEKKNFDPDVLVQARLAPDQYALVQQVQSACAPPKEATAYLSGQKAPSHPDTEKTIEELRRR